MGEILINGLDCVGAYNTKESRRKLRELQRRFSFTGNNPEIFGNDRSLIHHMSYIAFVNDKLQVVDKWTPRLPVCSNCAALAAFARQLSPFKICPNFSFPFD